MKLTLVVPVKDEVKTIQECAQSILRQTYKDFEVIFVDGGSTDGTYEFLEKIRRKERKVKVLRELGLGPGFARDLGFKAGKGEILAHIDGDNVAAENYLELCVQKLHDSCVAGVRPGLEFTYEDSFLGEVLRLRRRMLYGDEPFTSDYPTVYWRRIYDKAGGVDPKLIIGEDYDLWIRLQRAAKEFRQVFVVEREAVVRNIPKERSLGGIFKHSIWYGSGIIPLLLKHPRVGLRFIAEPVFYPIMIASMLAFTIHRLSLILIFPLIFILRWGIFVLRKADRIRGVRELILALVLIPLIRIIESLGSFLGILKHLTSKLKNTRRSCQE